MTTGWTSRPQFILDGTPEEVFGSNEPVATEYHYRTGPLTVCFVDGQIGPILWHGRVAIRGLHVLVRDTGWARLPAHVGAPSMQREDGADVIRLTGRVMLDGSQFNYTCIVKVFPGPRFVVRLTGTLSAPAEVNRLGMIVLHPAEAAGQKAACKAACRPAEPTRLPTDLLPHQPFRDMRNFSHDLPGGGRVSFSFEGAIFEMEDQRNWTDASFKTYCPPLGPPLPYALPAGEIEPQTVSVALEGMPAPVVLASRDCVEVSLTQLRSRMPSLGVSGDPPAGTTILHRAVHLRADSELSPDQKDDAVSLMLNAVMRTDHHRRDIEAIARACEANGLFPKRVSLLFPTTLRTTAEAYSAARAAFPESIIGGGSIAHFIDLHRAPERLEGADFATHALCPVVHDSDDMAVLETVGTLDKYFKASRKTIGARDLILHHAGLSLPFKPNGASTTAFPASRRATSNGQDPRDGALHGLAWAIGVLSEAIEAGVSGIYFEPRLAAQLGFLGDASQAPAAKCNSANPERVRAFRWLAEDGPMLAVSNLSRAPVQLRLVAPDGITPSDADMELRTLETKVVPTD